MLRRQLRGASLDHGIHHIYLAVCLQQGVFGAAWALAALLWRDVRSAAWLWVAFCALSASSLLLIISRDVLPPWLGVVGANLVLVLAFVAVWRGVERFFDRPASGREQAGMLLGMAAVLAWAGPGVEGNAVRVPLLTTVLTAIILRTMSRSHRAMRDEFGARVAWAVHAPPLVVAAVFLLRSLWALGHPPEGLNVDASLRSSVALGYAMLLACNAVHLAFGAMLLARLSRRLLHLSQRDALTGLLNRRAMAQVLDREWQRHRRYGSPLTLLMLDLDHFKAVNDQHGHEQGDQALLALAQVLTQTLRPSDTAARMGGEEFLVLLPGIDGGQGHGVADRLRQQLAAVPLGEPGRGFVVTASLGVAQAGAADHSWRDVLRRADRALYAAKAGGRNQVRRQDGASGEGG